MLSYDEWLTSPDECSFCGGEHTKRYCQAWKDEKAEADEMKADMERDERDFLYKERHETAQ